MSSFGLKFIAKRLLKDNQWNRFGVEDPYYEYVQYDPKRPDKFKRIERRLPAGINQNDLDILKKFKRRAYRYDMWFNIFGVRFGWTNIVGLIPVFGATVSLYWSGQLYLLAMGLDDKLPLDIQLLFIFNVVIDFLLSLIPIVGELVTIGYKANLRNYLLLEKHLDRVGQKNLGVLSPEEVRPGFINDKVQPFLEEKVAPGAVKLGGNIKEFIELASSKASGSITSSLSTPPSSVDSTSDSKK